MNRVRLLLQRFTRKPMALPLSRQTVIRPRHEYQVLCERAL